MNRIILLLICVIGFFSPNFNIASEEYEDSLYARVDDAIDFCIDDESDAGFLLAKSLIYNCKDYPDLILKLKRGMCFCDVSYKYLNEILDVADDVIKSSSTDFMKSVAWHQKSKISFRKRNFIDSINYAKISMHILMKDKKNTDEITLEDRYAFRNQNIKIFCYRGLKMQEEFNKEMKFMKDNFKWISPDYFKLKFID